ncbi:hypothetical protein M758_11G021400 [Ceratodon purpureus]|nr:hypothetical protein M758_11G021400 [Ceratodon purpureus]
MVLSFSLIWMDEEDVKPVSGQGLSLMLNCCSWSRKRPNRAM